MIPTPKTWWVRLLSTQYVYEVLVAFFLVLGGVANSIRGYNQPGWEVTIGNLWMVSAVGVLVVSLAKTAVLWLKYTDSESVHELEGCLHVLHAMVLTLPGSSNRATDCRLRITVHVPTDGDRFLQQVTGYVGDQEEVRRKVGRKLPIQSGIIGKAFRDRRIVVGNRQNQNKAQFVRELQEEWGFSEQEAKDIDSYSQSWLAVPIGATGENAKVYGVVFADSDSPEFFDQEAQNLFLSGAIGIAGYTVRRYKS